MSVSFCGLELAHPIVNGSGTFDAIAARLAFGPGFDEVFPFSAYVSKTITAAPRAGNPPPRLFEVPAGLINSIGLPNKGLDGYLESDLPQLATLPVPLITNVMANSAKEIAPLIEALDARPEVAALELNVSCPNVRTGLDIGSDAGELGRFVSAVRPLSAKPLIVKLTPNAADVPGIAQAAEAAGADAVSLLNTLRAFAPAPRGGGAAWLGGETGGMSGPALRAVALAQVRAVAARVTIPIVGMGGVATGSDARAFLDAGATLVAVGTESFRDALAGARIRDELAELSANSGLVFS